MCLEGGAFRAGPVAAGSFSALGGHEDLPAGVALPGKEAQLEHDDLLHEAFSFGAGSSLGAAVFAVWCWSGSSHGRGVFVLFELVLLSAR